MIEISTHEWINQHGERNSSISLIGAKHKVKLGMLPPNKNIQPLTTSGTSADASEGKQRRTQNPQEINFARRADRNTSC